jgi:hypothetical protein
VTNEKNDDPIRGTIGRRRKLNYEFRKALRAGPAIGRFLYGAAQKFYKENYLLFSRGLCKLNSPPVKKVACETPACKNSEKYDATFTATTEGQNRLGLRELLRRLRGSLLLRNPALPVGEFLAQLVERQT